RGKAREAPGVRRAEVGEPLVVDPHDLDGGLGVVHAAGGAEDAVEHLGLHAVAVLVLDAQIGIAESPDALLAVRVEPGFGHAVGAVDAARDVFAARRAHAVDEAELSALFRDPAFALRSLLDVRHALAHLGRGLRDEEVGGQPAEIEVASGGDHLVTDGASQGPTHTLSPSVRASTGCPPAAR